MSNFKFLIASQAVIRLNFFANMCVKVGMVVLYFSHATKLSIFHALWQQHGFVNEYIIWRLFAEYPHICVDY